MSNANTVKEALEAKARETGLALTTLGRMVGQGGKFYERLTAGARVWPETAESVLRKLEHVETPSASAEGSCLSDQGNNAIASKQGEAAQ